MNTGTLIDTNLRVWRGRPSVYSVGNPRRLHTDPGLVPRVEALYDALAESEVLVMSLNSHNDVVIEHTRYVWWYKRFYRLADVLMLAFAYGLKLYPVHPEELNWTRQGRDRWSTYTLRDANDDAVPLEPLAGLLRQVPGSTHVNAAGPVLEADHRATWRRARTSAAGWVPAIVTAFACGTGSRL